MTLFRKFFARRQSSDRLPYRQAPALRNPRYLAVHIAITTVNP